MNPTKVPIALKGFNHKTLLTISSTLEIDGTTVKDVIFATFLPSGNDGGYDSAKKQTVLFNANDLRAFVYGCKEILSISKQSTEKKGIGKYRKYASKANSSTKSISFGFDKSGEAVQYWINYSDSNKNKVGVGMNFYELMGLIDSLNLIADETETAQYRYQREVKKQIAREDRENIA